MRQRDIKVLIASSGAPGGPSIVKNLLLGDFAEIVLGDFDENSTSRLIFTDILFVKTPHVSAPAFLQEYIHLCKENDIDIILPLSNIEMGELVRYKHDFEEVGITLVATDYDIFQRCNDKGRLYRELECDLSIKLPKFEIVNNLSSFEKAVHSLGYPNKKVVVKPCVSSGSRGVRILSPEASSFEWFINTPPSDLHASFDSVRACLESASKKFSLMVTEYLPGRELTVDALRFSSNIVSEVDHIILIRERSVVHGGLSVAGKFLEDDNVNSQVKYLLQKFSLFGPIGFQFKEDSDGVFRLIEMNLRLQGTTSACVGTGFNLPLLAIADAAGLELTERLPDNGRVVGFVRHWSESFYQI